MTRSKARMAAAAAVGAVLYAVQWDIKHNGTRYAVGDEVPLNDEDAAPFLASGAIVAATPKADPEAEAAAAAEAEERAKAEAEAEAAAKKATEESEAAAATAGTADSPPAT
ncbi:hypothetical protein [Methyloversatilis sp. XJ19-49]|uniref:hypothetical protein n=1 Tax=Methyloversatilis sp. XJ19-49 TaxID=2963429 RepID=UPI00211CB8EB|nr:hypothetical protein [Methyloversatilis sp. XJ19-49]MCQ9378811.1 hypothetical protein [Methyloversatilis sp. XJ19-49]